MHPFQVGVKNFWKVFAGGEGVRNFHFGGGLYCWGRDDNFVGGSLEILKENLKMHNPSTKSIFRITSLTH